MQVFDALKKRGFGELHLCHDESSGLMGIIAIHSTKRGPALGGCRFIHYETQEAAITDALRLARGMTYKAAISNLPLGGGKSVIIKPRGDFDRNALFSAFGAAIDNLGGRYITAEDSGTTLDDMSTIRTQTKHVTGVKVAEGGSGDPSPLTALGVRRGLEAFVHYVMQRDDIAGVRVAVQGVGNVGYHLCKELHALGAKLVVSDIDPEKVERVVSEFGAEKADLDKIHAVECDVFAPCALGAGLNDQTLPELKCKIIAGAANNQLAEARHGDELSGKGIAYAPDYAINAGGLMNVQSELEGYDKDAATKKIMGIYDIMREIVERAHKTDKPTHRVADAIAEEKFL